MIIVVSLMPVDFEAARPDLTWSFALNQSGCGSWFRVVSGLY